MSGFKKIEFSNTTSAAKQDAAGRKGVMAKKKKKFKIPRKLAIALGVVVGLSLLMLIPAYSTYQSGLKTYREAKLIGDAVKKQNLAVAAEQITKTKKSLKETQQNFNLLIPLKFVPIVGWYYSDAEHALKAADHGLDTATIITDSLEPYTDVLGLNGEGTFSAGSAEERIKTAVMTTGKITPEIDKIAEKLDLVQKEVDQIQPWHYPSLIFGKDIHDQIAGTRELVDQSTLFVNDARPLVKMLPSLLGEKEPKKYLILFQNDKELRPTGGFLTGYAIFRVDQGVITPEKNEDIYDLDNTIANKPKAHPAILKYLSGVSVMNLRDSNMSPDFIESMQDFRSLYDRAGGKTEVDGIIALDTHFLVSVIKILDDTITAGGMTFTTKEDPRCDCPQVIYALENNISRPVGYIRTERKSLLGDLLNALLVKALSSSPKLYWGPLFQSIVKDTGEKHVLFYLFDKDAQQGVEALNAAGKIQEFDGDYLHINEANFSGAKVNIFMQETVDSNYEVDRDGVITKTVTINYKNPYPPSDCNLERGGLCLNATYRDWIRVYVPKGSELIESKGSEVKVVTEEDLGKTVFEGFVTVRPQGVATYTLKYKLPFKLASNAQLPILLQKQPGTYGYDYNISVDGKKKENFPLLTDKELMIKL
ncbi:MAG: DUF4012 domain-containing protein [Patescibacteria group bacterium]